MFKIKDECKFELETSETMKLFDSTKKLKRKINNGENVPSFEVVEVVLEQCTLVNNQYQQKSKANSLSILRSTNLMVVC